MISNEGSVINDPYPLTVRTATRYTFDVYSDDPEVRLVELLGKVVTNAGLSLSTAQIDRAWRYATERMELD